MAIQYAHTLIMVRDIRVSKTFYEQTVGIPIVEDFGNWVVFEGGLVLHEAASFRKLIGSDATGAAEPQGARNIDVYFETDELALILDRLKNAGVAMIHDIQRQDWGQSVFRCYDPDGHVVEIGEPSFLDFA